MHAPPIAHSLLAAPNPALCRAGTVARALGISKRLLISEAEAGRLPIRVVRIGPARTAYLNRQDATAYLARQAGSVR